MPTSRGASIEHQASSQGPKEIQYGRVNYDTFVLGSDIVSERRLLQRHQTKVSNWK